MPCAGSGAAAGVDGTADGRRPFEGEGVSERGGGSARPKVGEREAEREGESEGEREGEREGASEEERGG